MGDSPIFVSHLIVGVLGQEDTTPNLAFIYVLLIQTLVYKLVWEAIVLTEPSLLLEMSFKKMAFDLRSRRLVEKV